MSINSFKRRIGWLSTIVLSLSVSFNIALATETDYTKRFLLGLYAGCADSELHRQNNDNLNINFLYDYQEPSAWESWCSSHDYCTEGNASAGAVALYSTERPAEAPDHTVFNPPTSLYAWKTDIVEGLLDKGDMINLMGHSLGEENPAFFDPLYCDAMNYVIPKVHEKFGQDQLIACNINTAVRPEILLWTKGLNSMWFYVYPFTFSYGPDPSSPPYTTYENYQDSLQTKFIDTYNRAWDMVNTTRMWGACPNFHMKSVFQAWQNANYDESSTDPEEKNKTRKPTHEEILLQGWIAISRGSKGLAPFLYQNGSGTRFIGLVDSYGNPNIEGGEDNWFYDEKTKTWINVEHDPAYKYYDGDALFTWVQDLFSKIKVVDDRLKNTYSYTNGLYDVDVDTFSSERGVMSIPLYYVHSIEPSNISTNEAYYEVAILRSETHSFFMIINRSLHQSQPVSYTVKVGVPWGKGEEWQLEEMVTGNSYTPEPKGAGEAEDEFHIVASIGPGEAKLFMLEYNGTPGGALTSNCSEATGYSNGRKLALSKIGDDIYAFLAYTDMTGSQPHIHWVASNDMGQTWSVTDEAKIENAQYPAIAVNRGQWPIMVYQKPVTGNKVTYEVKDCCSGRTLTLRECEGGGSPPSMTIYSEGSKSYKCHVVFFDKRSMDLCHYVIDQGDFTATQPSIDIYELYWPNPPGARRPTVVCDKSGNTSIFFAFDDDLDINNHGHIYYWDGESQDARKLLFAEGWDATAFIDDYALLLTWVAPDQCTWPRGEIRAKYVPNLSDKIWFSGQDYEVPDPNPDMSEVQPMGTNAAMWQSQVAVYYSTRDDEHANFPADPWGDRVTLDNSSRCPQNALEQYLYTYATAWTKGTSAPYTIETDVGYLNDAPGGAWNVVNVVSPNGGETWRVGRSQDIVWTSYYSDVIRTQWRVFISYDCGQDWRDHPIPVDANSYKAEGHTYRFTWTPENPSTQCLIQVAYWNSSDPNDWPYDISNSTFKIKKFGWPPDDKQLNQPGILGIHPPGTQREVYWEIESLTGLEGMGLQYSTDNGGSWNDPTMLLALTLDPPDDSLFLDTIFSSDSTDTSFLYKYWGTIAWTVPNEPTSAAKIKLIAHDTLGDTASLVQDSSFIIPLPGGWVLNTWSNQEVWALNDAGTQPGLFYTGRNSQDTTKPIIYYTESPDGYSLNVPDSMGIGILPCHQLGEAFWLSRMRDTIFHSSWDNGIPNWGAAGSLFTDAPGFDSTRHSPIGLAVDADTVHIVFERRVCRIYVDQLKLLHAALLKESGTLLDIDTIGIPITTGAQNNEAPGVQAKNGNVYLSYWKSGVCFFAERDSSGQFLMQNLGTGRYPIVALTEGNVVYSYIAPDGKSLIRLWRYRDDSVWVKRDTFTLDDSMAFLTGQDGILYTTQAGDTAVCKTYVYDPLGKRLIERFTRDGSYPHSYLWRCSDDQWTECYTGYVDTFRFVKTETNDLNAFFPSLYQEADTRISPYTVHRDTFIEYHDCTVDYGSDSLVYSFNRLDQTLSYSVMVEFYFESETDTTVNILANVGGTVDTVEVQSNSYVWHQVRLPSTSSSFTLRLIPLNGGFVSVSRLAAGQVDASLIQSKGGTRLEEKQPLRFCLYQPYPNPFMDKATIMFSVPYKARVSLKVYDVSGRLVTKLVDGDVEAGLHTLRWEGKDDINRKCPSGVYFVRLATEEYEAAKKMVLLK